MSSIDSISNSSSERSNKTGVFVLWKPKGYLFPEFQEILLYRSPLPSFIHSNLYPAQEQPLSYSLLAEFQIQSEKTWHNENSLSSNLCSPITEPLHRKRNRDFDRLILLRYVKNENPILSTPSIFWRNLAAFPKAISSPEYGPYDYSEINLT